MKTSNKQISLFGEDELTSSQEDSHASHTQWQESEKEKKMRDISGRRCLERFGRFNRNGSWAKTFSELLIGTGGWYSMRCSLTWRLKGTKYNRMFFQLVPSTLRTEGTGFGLLPTINSCDANTANHSNNHDLKKGYLRGMATAGLLPTPAPGTHDRGMHPHKGVVNALLNNEKPKIQELLVDRVFAEELKKQGVTYVESFRQKLSPTPTWQDGGKNASLPPSQINRADSIVKRILLEDPKAGQHSQLNPLFVAEMMGFPVDWTVLPFQNGETKA